MKPEHERQYRHNKNKSIIYQNAVFNRFGSELSFINITLALIRTVDEFNTRYEDQIHARHAMLILMIKHYTTAHNSTHFTSDEVFSYYPHVHLLFGFAYDDQHRSFLKVFNDLMHLNFINYLGPQNTHAPTMRIKLFCDRYEHHCKELFKDPDK